MDVDFEAGLEAEQDEIFAALSAAAKETGFAPSEMEDDSGIEEPTDTAVEDTRISEQDVRDGKLDEKPIAQEADDQGADDEGPDADQSIDWSAHGFDERDASALSALSAGRAAELNQSLTAFGAMKDLLDTYREPYAQRGLNLTVEQIPEYMANLAKLDHYAATNPEGYVKYLVNERLKLDPAKLFGLAAKGSASDDDDWDPWGDDEEEATAVEPKKEEPAKSAFDPMKPNDAEIAAQNRRVAERIGAFAQEKNGAGELTRPHFERVAPVIQSFMAVEKQNGKVFDLNNLQSELDRLYRQAVLATPDLGAAELAKIEAATARQEGEARAREGQERVRKAARASRTATSPAPGARSSGAASDDLPIDQLIAGIARGEIKAP